MKDQYGNDIPKDLVLVPNINNLRNKDIKTVDRAAWYEQDGILLVSASEIGFLSEDDPMEAGVIPEEGKIMYVGSVLHRWSEEDGFYHA